MTYINCPICGSSVPSNVAVCPACGEYINSGGYEGGSGSEIMIGEEYRVNGAKFRVDLVFSSGYVASNDVTYTD